MDTRAATPADAGAIAAIYNHYVTHTAATFEEEAVSPSEMARRIQRVQSASLPWLIAERDGGLLGYAYASRWRDRRAYRFSAEITAYVDPACERRGIGAELYRRILPLLASRGVHTVVAGIALPNEASVAFHEKFAFVKVAHLKEVGFKFDRWIDVGYWQRILEDVKRTA